MTRLCAAFLLFSAASFAQPVPQSPLTVGSGNTAVADPTIPRPDNVKPCRVTLYTNQQFADFSPKPFAYAPPAACPGPWQKVVLEADYSVEAGLQFDRTANLWIGGVNIYFGTTAEPSGKIGRSWHVERDLTDYSALLLAPAAGEADLGNLVNTQFTSSLWGTADIAFYPVSKSGKGNDNSGKGNNNDGPVTADLVLPMSAGPTGGSVGLNTPTDALQKTFTLPLNVEKALLDVVLEPQSANDEFWYTCVPNNLGNELESCIGTAFREGEVTIDGVPAGVVPISPWIYTGGIDPLLWRPIPGVQTLNFAAYRVDVTPFAATLSDGKPHTIAITVFNNSVSFSTTATLLVFLDHGAKKVTGAITTNTIGTPSPVLKTNLATDAAGTTTGNVTISSNRHFLLAGFVKTSHGTVRTEVEQSIAFSNSQSFVAPTSAAINFEQDITQRTEISSVTRTLGDDNTETRVSQSWPLDLTITVPPDGTFQSTIHQTFDRTDLALREGEVRSGSFVTSSVAPKDNFPSGQGQANSQHYFSADSTGACFSRTITAAGGFLTSIVNGADCEHDHH
ncbi:MAG TPA: peptide-N4-asparagine amidase [Myxococcales bacterium]|nr:peptide-N4-asparagine amidase [Myxococcales bacterium]